MEKIMDRVGIRRKASLRERVIKKTQRQRDTKSELEKKRKIDIDFSIAIRLFSPCVPQKRERREK